MDGLKAQFPSHARELSILLEQDQKEWKDFAHEYLTTKDKHRLEAKRISLQQNVRHRAKRALYILSEIKEPSISNIGEEGAIALSILATHSSIEDTKTVLEAFKALNKKDHKNAHYQSIPPMTDLLLILEHKPQIFGTIWLFDSSNQPFLPTVRDFQSVNERRALYDIGPLRWPKSLAIPESQQPWLKKPVSSITTRDPSDDEFEEFAKNYIA